MLVIQNTSDIRGIATAGQRDPNVKNLLINDRLGLIGQIISDTEVVTVRPVIQG